VTKSYPSPETIQQKFGAEHPASLFYVHLLPLLNGIAVQLQRKGHSNDWLPRIVSLAPDWGRIKINRADRVVAESFVPVGSLRSINVPDATLRQLHSLSVADSPKHVKNLKPFQLHVLQAEGEPLRMAVPAVSNFHELTQAFKIIVETPREQLAYFAVILGLGGTVGSGGAAGS
jgi:hypothetical protein